jgi:hypothetical protein
MKVWFGAIVKLDDGEIGQVTVMGKDGTATVRLSSGAQSTVSESILMPASFDEITAFRAASNSRARPLAGQKRFGE